MMIARPALSAVTLVIALVCGAPLAAKASSLQEALALKRQEKLPEAAALLAELVKENPKDLEALEQLAIVQGWLGRYDDSIVNFGALLAQAPSAPAARGWEIGRARIRYWKGDHAKARAELDGVLAAAPKDGDALSLAGDVALAQGDSEAARGYYQRALALAPADADLSKKLSRTEAPPRLRLDVGGEFDGFGKFSATSAAADRGVEGSWFGQAGYQLSKDLTLGAGFEELRWFGFIDHRVNAVADVRVSPDFLLSARAALTPSNHFLAAWEAGAGAELKARPLTALLALKHLSYTGNEVTLLQPGVRFESGSFSVQAQGIVALSSRSDPAGAGIVRLGWAFGDAVATWLGASYGKEALSTPAGTTFALVSAVFTGLSWAVTPVFGVRLDLGYERREEAYQKGSGALGFTFKL